MMFRFGRIVVAAGILSVMACSSAQDHRESVVSGMRKDRDSGDAPLPASASRLLLSSGSTALSGTVIHTETRLKLLDMRITVLGHQMGASHEVTFGVDKRSAIFNGALYNEGDVVELSGQRFRIRRILRHDVELLPESED